MCLKAWLYVPHKSMMSVAFTGPLLLDLCSSGRNAREVDPSSNVRLLQFKAMPCNALWLENRRQGVLAAHRGRD